MHSEIAPIDLVAFVSKPTAVVNKEDLEGWSPVLFTDNHRHSKNVEAISAIGLDDDDSGKTTNELAEVWAPFAGVIHTTASHMRPKHGDDVLPRHRVILRTSRDVTNAEYKIIWRLLCAFAASRGQALDPSPKDASRFWYAPGHVDGAPYAWRELTGAPLPVDAMLAAAPAETPSASPGPSARPEAPSAQPADTRKVAAILGAVWPDEGRRHDAKMALAGGFYHDGKSEAEALAFLKDVYTHVQSDNGGKLDNDKNDVSDTFKRGALGTHIAGWNTLSSIVGPKIVDAVRSMLCGTSAMEARLAAVRAANVAELPPDYVRSPGGLVFRSGGWSQELPARLYTVKPLIAAGSVTLLVAIGGSLKSMTLLSLMAAVATGKPWLGAFDTVKGSAFIIDWERSEYEAWRRLKVLRLDVGLDGLHYCAQPGMWRADRPEFWTELETLKPSIVGIDSFAASANGVDENDARAALPMQLAASFAQRTQIPVVGIHHTRKGAGGDRREAVRGSSAIFAAIDAAYEFESIDAPDGVKRTRVRNTKFNLGRQPDDFAVELTDERGLVLYEEPAASEGRNADTSDELQAAIKLALADGPSPGVRALAKRLGKNTQRVNDALGLLQEGREIVKTDEGYMLDGAQHRRDRVLAFVAEHPGDPRFTISRLAKASHVGVRDVERLLLERAIVCAVGTDRGGFLLGS